MLKLIYRVAMLRDFLRKVRSFREHTMRQFRLSLNSQNFKNRPEPRPKLTHSHPLQSARDNRPRFSIVQQDSPHPFALLLEFKRDLLLQNYYLNLSLRLYLADLSQRFVDLFGRAQSQAHLGLQLRFCVGIQSWPDLLLFKPHLGVCRFFYIDVRFLSGIELGQPQVSVQPSVDCLQTGEQLRRFCQRLN